MPPITAKKKPATSKKSGPEVVHAEYRIVQYTKGSEAGPLTAEVMKELIGWTTDKEEAEKAGVFHSALTDLEGNKVYLTKNKGNRPLEKGDAMKYGQDMLNRNWKRNGEGLSVGEYGNVISGQHRGIGLILAEQRRVSEKEKAHWKKVWGDEPLYIETHVAFGVGEDNDTKRTVDNVKTRTLTDVLYGTGKFEKIKSLDNGGKLKPNEEKTLCRTMEYAVKTLWERTGAKKNPYSKYRTHSESLEFIDEHPTLLDCVVHVWTEFNRDWQTNTQRIPAGTASGLMYLMTVSETDPEKYEKKRNEKSCDTSMKAKAEEFWFAFCEEKEDKELLALRNEIAKLSDGENDNSAISAEKIGMVCKAWNLFKDGEKVTAKAIKVRRDPNEKGHMLITDDAIDVMGIDKGPYKVAEEEDEAEDKELTERIKAAQKEKEEQVKAGNVGKGKGKKKLKGGNTEEVVVEDEEPVSIDDDEEELISIDD
jgi:hypothetical protein